MRARARLLLVSVAIAAATGACVHEVSYRARRAPLGDPSWPGVHVDGVTTAELVWTPGLYSTSERVLEPIVTRGGFKGEETSANIERDVLWNLRLQGGDGTDVLTMMWSAPKAPRCQGGHPALDLLLDLDAPPNHTLAPDRQVHWERPVVVRGERVISGRFDEDPELLRRDSVLDVHVVQHDGGATRDLCLRVPATGPDVTYWNQKRWSVGARASFRRSLAFTPSSTLGLALSLGRWFGPVRVGLEGIIGGTYDDSPDKESLTGTFYCFTSAGPACDAVGFGGFAVEASGIARRWGRNWAIGWSVGYEALFAGLKRLEPDGTFLSRNASSGGPRLALQLLRAAPDLVGVSRSSPTSAVGGELFVSVPQEWTGAANGHHVTFGVSALAF